MGTFLYSLAEYIVYVCNDAGAQVSVIFGVNSIPGSGVTAAVVFDSCPRRAGMIFLVNDFFG